MEVLNILLETGVGESIPENTGKAIQTCIDEIKGHIGGFIGPRAHGENGMVAVIVKPDEIETDSLISNIKQAIPELKDVRVIEIDARAVAKKRKESKERLKKVSQLLDRPYS
jgi:hypothetical protein